MSYCINPKCEQRENPDNATVCHACHTPLLLCNYYRIIEPLCKRENIPKELFQITDLRNKSLGLVLKTLIPGASEKVQELFHREQQILMQMRHPGIPRGHDCFSICLANGGEIQCLVMGKIPGENLEHYIKYHGAITQNQAIAWLKQLLHILDYLHSLRPERVFHRDIKPSNIMRRPDGTLVLIDFGSVRQVTETIINGHTSTIVCSYGYTAPEQIDARATPQSDFYALGITFMELLMGKKLENGAFKPSRRVLPALNKLLHDMTAEQVGDRPATAKLILEQLQEIEAQEGSRKRWQQIRLSFGIGMLCGGLAMIPLMRQINWDAERDRWFPKAACDSTVGDRVSCGEESLLQPESLESLLGDSASRMADTKREAIQHLQNREWELAKQAFKTVWEKTSDPEALVYWNNLKVQTDPTLYRRTATIAAVTPVSDTKARVARGFNILRGVAQAQTEAIQAGTGLQVVLVDDNNDPQIAKKLAKDLVRRQNVLAVIGHHVSDATRAALAIYDAAKLIAISPTSTSEELATYTLKKEPLFFRTVHSDRVTATFMASFLLNRTTVRTVAVFYNPDKSYSRSLAGAFKETFQALQGKVVSGKSNQFYLSCTGSACPRPAFNVKTALRDAKTAGATALIVIPDAAESRSNALSDAIDLVKTAGKTWVITGDTLAGEEELLQPGVAKRTIIVSAWDPSQTSGSKLVKFWQPRPIGSSEHPLSWHTYTTYNAAQVLITAIQQHREQPLDRATLQQQLIEPGFVAQGVSGEIRFRDGTGELQNPQVVITGVLQCGEKTIFQVLEQKTCP
jgi:eukaryotic-like serine/threonine-protein kinase